MRCEHCLKSARPYLVQHVEANYNQVEGVNMAESDAEREIINDIFEEGKLENETGSMETSIPPQHDIEDKYPEQKIAHAIEDAPDQLITETTEAGTDDDGNSYGSISENVTGEA